jgi:hypothetical protein
MKELFSAMALAFPKIEGAIKDCNNPYFKSKYADLSSVVAAIKPALGEHGLCFVQHVHSTPNFASVETVILHSSGESMSCGITSVPIGKLDAQGYGSALTYARRYSLSAAFGVAPEDDDGNLACKKNEAKEQKPPVDDDKPAKTYEKLSPKEIKSLSAKVCSSLEDDQALNCVLNEDEMVRFLTEWQEKQSLIGKIEPMLLDEGKRKSILSGHMRALERWKKEETTSSGNRAA